MENVGITLKLEIRVCMLLSLYDMCFYIILFLAEVGKSWKHFVAYIM